MPSFSDSIFLFILALLLFGPKKLPVLARELGKWVGEFRRASNEFKMQMEEELRLSEQEERRKQIAEMESAAPLPAPIEEPEHPHLQSLEAPPDRSPNESSTESFAAESFAAESFAAKSSAPESPAAVDTVSAPHGTEASSPAAEPLPIAASGELRMMPPATGLPTPRPRPGSRPNGSEQEPALNSPNALSSLVSSIPHDEPSENGHFLKATGSPHGA